MARIKHTLTQMQAQMNFNFEFFSFVSLWFRRIQAYTIQTRSTMSIWYLCVSGCVFIAFKHGIRKGACEWMEARENNLNAHTFLNNCFCWSFIAYLRNAHSLCDFEWKYFPGYYAVLRFILQNNQQQMSTIQKNIV